MRLFSCQSTSGFNHFSPVGATKFSKYSRQAFMSWNVDGSFAAGGGNGKDMFRVPGLGGKTGAALL
eukprot:CAMPEP_0174901498 /NCGR_PEP_ID=MMETSP0167-20121228/34749_1 /TAXON_ID=38298 /ORGANISM="Rhodella maculata, Strain CCMP736" /LENGTH=65 /DNA_ID=CAMNT_0016143187 /DNA_START=194 /DNA_END=391 /DNA_ORIENTATION=-